MYNGEQRHIHVCRYKCACCGRIHTGLPEQVVPFKHYGAEVIESAVDEIIEPGAPEAEDYPCEKTFRNWTDWINKNTPHIDSALRSIGSPISFLFFGELHSVNSFR